MESLRDLNSGNFMALPNRGRNFPTDNVSKLEERIVGRPPWLRCPAIERTQINAAIGLQGQTGIENDLFPLQCREIVSPIMAALNPGRRYPECRRLQAIEESRPARAPSTNRMAPVFYGSDPDSPPVPYGGR